ncbi:MAG: hypothetical protein HC929_15040 [Leptolyngbyaceae cyanobacterium SM2_5_2]|nr:hypothetical protein [Leptolyngbyaceae cyanobacterium SM2_5_2]
MPSHRPATRPPAGLGQAQHRPPQATQSPLSQIRLPQTNSPPLESSQAAIVPKEEVHPLDWSEASIAHTLDLRQRHSLSSWL